MSFFGRVLAFYTVGIGPLNADWLELQRVTSLRHGALACCRGKSAAARKRFSRLATVPVGQYTISGDANGTRPIQRIVCVFVGLYFYELK